MLRGSSAFKRIREISICFRELNTARVHPYHLELVTKERCRSGNLTIRDARNLFDELLRSNPSPCIVTFGVLLNAVLSLRYHSLVFSMYNRMVHVAEVPPSSHIHGILINCSRLMGHPDLGFGVLGHVLKSGSSPNSVMCTSLVNGLCSSGRILDARKVFDKMRELGCAPNVVTYNTLIDCCCCAGSIGLGFGLLCDMMRSGLLPDVVTFGSLIGGLSRKIRVRDALDFFGRIRHAGVEPNLKAYNSVIDCCCQVGMVEGGFLFLNQMMKRGYRPDIVTFNTLLHGLWTAGRLPEAASLFHVLLDLGVRVDAISFGTLIHGLCSAGQLDVGLGLLSSMMKCAFQPDMITFNCLINGLCSSQRTHQAAMVIRRMEDVGYFPDASSFTSLVQCCCSVGRVDLGLAYIGSMMKRNFQGDDEMLTSLVRGLFLSNQITDAGMVIARMLERKVGALTYNILISYCCRCNQLKVGLGILCEMMKWGYAPDRIAIESLLSGLCFSGKIAHALMLFRRFEEMGFVAGTATFNSLIRCCSCVNRVDVGLGLLSDMMRRGCLPDKATYTIILVMLFESGRNVEAAWFFRRMKEAVCIPDAVAFSAVINCCCNLNHLELGFGVLCDMMKHGHLPDTITLSGIVDGYCMENRIAEAASLVRRMLEMGSPPNVVTYTTFIKGLCRAGNINMAVNLLKEMSMLDSSCKPNIVTYTTVIRSLLRKGLIIEARRLLEIMRASGIYPNARVYKLIIDFYCKSGLWLEAMDIYRNMVDEHISIDTSYNFFMHQPKEG